MDLTVNILNCPVSRKKKKKNLNPNWTPITIFQGDLLPVTMNNDSKQANLKYQPKHSILLFLKFKKNMNSSKVKKLALNI